MDDDTKHYTIQLKGKAYRFQPIPRDSMERLGVLQHLEVSGAKIVRSLSKILAASAGPDQWDEITDRYVAGEFGYQEFTTDLLKRLLERQKKDDPESFAADAE